MAVLHRQAVRPNHATSGGKRQPNAHPRPPQTKDTPHARSTRANTLAAGRACLLPQRNMDLALTFAAANATSTSFRLPNEILQHAFDTGRISTPSGSTRRLHSMISGGEGMLLYHLVKQHRLKRSLEIGLAFGISALFIAQGHLDAMQSDASSPHRHVAVDPMQRTDWESIGMHQLGLANAAHLVELRTTESHIALPHALARNESYDLILIDGMHMFDFALVDFFFADLLLMIRCPAHQKLTHPPSPSLPAPSAGASSPPRPLQSPGARLG